MSRGRHSRPRARGGGLAALLALVFAGGAVAAALIQPTGRNLRLALVGFAVASALSLLVLARTQRSSSRSVARIEDRLHALEQRNRDEGDQLHRRVLEGMAREGQLFGALEVLAAEISRLRAALESLAQAGPDAVSAFGRHSAHTAADLAAAMAAPTVIDVPLVQRIFAVQEEAPARAPADVPPAATPAAAAAGAASAAGGAGTAATGSLGSVAAHVPAHAAAREAAASATFGVTAEPAAAAAAVEGTEFWGPPAVADPDGLRPSEPLVSSWVVRELQLDQTPDAPLPRILDLTQPGSATEPPAADGEGAARTDDADHADAQAWSSFARPA